jgi:hypothetical protein
MKDPAWKIKHLKFGNVAFLLILMKDPAWKIKHLKFGNVAFLLILVKHWLRKRTHQARGQLRVYKGLAHHVTEKSDPLNVQGGVGHSGWWTRKE